MHPSPRLPDGVLPAAEAPDPRGTVGNGDTAVVADYTEAVFRRSREPMPPLGFEVDWDDQPSRHKTYPGATRLPLPRGLAAGPAAVLLDAGATGPGGGWDRGRLASLLRLSYGVLGRRMAVNWNQDAEKRAHYPAAAWSRGTASGGGMYPLELYVVSGAGGPLLPGVYHYATAHHELERLLTGDVTGRVASALGADDTGLYVLAAVRFWKNSFKYNSFCYHVVTQDAGALAGSWDVLTRSLGERTSRALWFDERALDDLLGLDGMTESVLAVLPLTCSAPAPAAAADPGPRPVAVAHERSERLLRFPTVDLVHAAALVGDTPRPPAGTHRAARPRPAAELGAEVALPAPSTGPFAGDLAGVLASRRSSFGGFTATPLALDRLATLLAAASTGGATGSDVKPAGERLTRLFVLANRVDGLEPGGYAYDPDGHALRRRPTPAEPLGELLQRHYLLTNYNTEQAAAVVAITGRLAPMLAAFGNRGYRVLNSEVGAVSQTCYLAAAALGVGCGAVLGLDNIALDDLLGVGPEHGSDERTLLFLLVGPERTDPADIVLTLDSA
ncbi:SagB family peptide dehydrogenase [Saccharothrix algeriensis]|uniref:SagB-type dehydrogenase family enzyme n=2 Tax=Saccharothrix algeriensis TaxID=173560 RepID=A0ABS2SE78_9PSEU|nr:SagB family peptide dehydrogenase [Saccharothrix algeriensis]MBM7814551.1 SagB-type dehydrogenase family enzyme [Saccharothrix algeriensis]